MSRKKQKDVIEALPFSEDGSNENTVARENGSESKKVKKNIFKDSFFALKEDTDMFTFVMTVVNMIVSVLWMVVYVALLIYRRSVFSNIEMSVTLNVPAYTVTFSSPLFAVLRVLVYVLAAVYIVWAVAVATASKRQKKLCAGSLLYTSVGLDFLVAILTFFDISAANLIFGVLA